jgi:4-amino-4-deoxy-L-arabinose transferase-like glycosyltransferase
VKRVVRAGREHPLEAVALALILLFAAAVRIAYVGDPPVRYDEVFTWQQYATNSVRHIVTDYTYPNNHILNSLAEHFSWRAFGESETVMRLPALAFGILLVAAAYGLARSLWDGAAAAWAAALVGGSSLLMQYSVNGRGYSMGMFFVLVAITAATVGTRERGVGWWPWVVLGVSSVLAVYTVPTMAGGVAIAFAWAAVRRIGAWKPLLISGAGTAVVTGLLYLPARGDQSWNPPSDWVVRGVGDKASVFDKVWEQWNDALPWPLQLVLVAGFVATLVGHRRLSPDALPFPAVALVATALIVLILPQSPLARTYLYLLPLYLVTAGAGLSLLIRLGAERMPRLGPRAEAITVAPAVAAALALTLSFVPRGDDRYSVDVPSSEKNIASLVRPDRPMMATVTMGDPLSFYLGGYDRGRPAYDVALLQGNPRKVVVAVAPGRNETLPGVLELLDVEPAQGSRPRLLRDGRWVDFYEVALP